jgi:uncharacterized protein
VNILIDIGHPAHVHYFKNLATILRSRGHKIIITVKKLRSAEELLKSNSFDFIELPEKSDSLFGKAFSQIRYDWYLLRLCKKFNIDLALGVSITITHLTRIGGIKSIAFDDDDDEIQPLFVKWAQPFASELLSPDVLKGKQKRKDVVYYPGYHELAYLHPSWFSPDADILTEIGLKKGEPYFVLRFNAFKAHHDSGVSGLSFDHKIKLVEILSMKGKVFITGERELDKEFEQYRLNINPEKIHSLIYYASMFIGDSQTMASEAAVLGTPSIRFNSLAGKISYLEEEEKKYGLTFGFRPDQYELFICKIGNLLSNPDIKAEWMKKRQVMLKDKIDVTSFWVWFVENYPESKKEYSLNPNLVNNFK